MPLINNAVVSCTHVDGTAGPQAVPAYVRAPRQRFTDQGGLQETYLLLDFSLLGQVRQQDTVTIAAYNGQVVALGPFVVSWVVPSGFGALSVLRVYLTGFSL